MANSPRGLDRARYKKDSITLFECNRRYLDFLITWLSYSTFFCNFFRAIVYLSFRLTNTTKVDWMPEAPRRESPISTFHLLKRKKSLLKTWDWQGKISVKASNKLFFAKIAKNCYCQQSSSILLLLLLEEKILPLRKIITLLLGKKKLILVQKHSKKLFNKEAPNTSYVHILHTVYQSKFIFHGFSCREIGKSQFTVSKKSTSFFLKWNSMSNDGVFLFSFLTFWWDHL